MRLFIILIATLAALLSACSPEPAVEPPIEGAAVKEAANANSPTSSARESWTRADAEFAFMCRGVLSAAYAARSILPDGERPEMIESISIGTTSRWAAEAFKRADAAGLTESEQNELMASTSRILGTKDDINSALPDIESCLQVIS